MDKSTKLFPLEGAPPPRKPLALVTAERGHKSELGHKGPPKGDGTPAFIQLQCLFVFARPLKALHSQLVPGQGAPQQLRAATAAGSTARRRSSMPAGTRSRLPSVPTWTEASGKDGGSLWKGKRSAVKLQMFLSLVFAADHAGPSPGPLRTAPRPELAPRLFLLLRGCCSAQTEPAARSRRHLQLRFPSAQILLQSPFPEAVASRSKSQSGIVNKGERIADFKMNSFARKKQEEARWAPPSLPMP